MSGQIKRGSVRSAELGSAKVLGDHLIARIAGTTVATALVMATLLSSPVALANGAAFYNDPNQLSEDNTIYFGIVKDQKGTPVVGANVQVDIAGQNIEYVYTTTSLGRYRSLDLPKTTDPKSVEVSVQMPGFLLVNQDNRTRTVKPGLPVEINFVLAQAKSNS